MLTPRQIQNLIKKVCGGADMNISGINGSLTPASAIRVMETIPVEERTCFYDVGAAQGIMVLCAVICWGFEVACGCELETNEAVHKPIFEAAKKTLEKKSGMTLSASIEYENFSSVPPDANVVFVFNAGFNAEDHYLVAREVVKSNAKYFICSRSTTFHSPGDVQDALEYKFALVATKKGVQIGSEQVHAMYVLERV
jgi:hypothetical protein